MDPLDDNEQRKKSLLDSLGPEPAPMGAPLPSVGDPGPLDKAGTFAPIGESAPTLPPPMEGPTKYGGTMGKFGVGAGYDQGKLANADHLSPKYQIGRTLSNFDPKAGITPDVLSALNSLNIGTFSGGKDKLTVGGNVDPRFEGYTNMDVIGGFNDPNNPNKSWGYQADNPNAPADAAPQGGGGMGGQFAPTINGPLDQQLGGNPLEAIQAALAKYGQGNRPNMDALLAQLG
jgi:hypothetical protein